MLSPADHELDQPRAGQQLFASPDRSSFEVLNVKSAPVLRSLQNAIDQISRIWDQPSLRRPWCQCHHKTAPTPTTAAAINTTSKAEFSIQAIAGMPSAMMRPRRQTCHESTCTPAVKVPNASRVKIASAVVCAVKILCTLLSSIKFITSRK